MKKVSLLGCALLASVAFADINFENIADTKPYANRVYGIRSVTQKDTNTLRVVLGATATGSMKVADAWRIISDKDPNYAYEKFVRPIEAELVESKVEFRYPEGRDMSDKGSIPLERSIVDLTLPTPMKSGCDYAAVAYGAGNECVTAALTGSLVGAPDGDDWASRIIGLRKVSNVGDGKIVCEFGAGYSAQGGNEARNWTVTVNGKPRAVRALGRRTKLDFYKTTGWPFGGVLLSDVFLDIGEALKDGDKVVVSAAPAVTCGERSASFTFDAKKHVSRSIQANQVGYPNKGLKVAYLSCWMASMPDKAFQGGVKAAATTVDASDFFGLAAEPAETITDDGKSAAYQKLADSSLRLDGDNIPFYIVNAQTGKTAYESTVKFIHSGNDNEGRNKSNANVWEIDFTEFSATGKYFISVPGVGRSIDFLIGPDAYRKAFKVQAQGVYCQRCGIEMDPKLSGGWKRIACHIEGIIPTSEKEYLNGEWGKFLENAEMVPNPYKTALDAKKATILNSASTAMANITDNKAGRGQKGIIPAAENGFSVSFFLRRDDAFGGNQWGGSVFSFSDNPKNPAVLGCSWGITTLVGTKDTVPRFGDKKWHNFTLTFSAPDAEKKRTCSLYFDGKFVSSTYRLYVPEQFFVANLNESKNNEGTTLKDVNVFTRALTAEEIALLSMDVPAEIPARMMIRGGHHDAGDYNPRSHLDVAQRLMELYELRPEAFSGTLS